MKILSALTRRGAIATLGGGCLLVLSYGVGSTPVLSAHAAGAQPASPAAAAAVTAPIAVAVNCQAAIPSTGVVHHRLEPADGSIALARQAHQVPLLILRGVAKGQARLSLEYADGHTEVRTVEVSAGPPPGVETVHVRVGQVQPGRATKNLKSFSAGTSGLIDVQVGPNNQDYIIRAIKPGTTSLLLLHEDSSTQQKLVEVTP